MKDCDKLKLLIELNDNLKKVLDCVCSQDALDRLEQKLAEQPIVPITEQDLKDKT
jgi:hypothetical protein